MTGYDKAPILAVGYAVLRSAAYNWQMLGGRRESSALIALEGEQKMSIA